MLENITDIDGGYYIYATIGDKVWHDQDADGEQDAGEPGINGINVTIERNYQVQVLIVNQNVNTAGGGIYQFTNIPPGTSYTINFDAGATYEITYQDETTDNLDSDPDPATGDVTNISVVSDDDLTDFDCGMYIFGTVGNSVPGKMYNGNGLQDGGEPAIAGIDVTLTGTTGNGTAVNETVTSDGTGNYQFSIMSSPETTASILMWVPLPFRRTYANIGANDAIDSDADETTGNTVHSSL